MQLVHTETTRQTLQMMASWKDTQVIEEYLSPGKEVVDYSLQTEMLKLTLHVITGAGYGRSLDWSSSGEISPGHTLSFIQSLRSLVDHLVFLFLFPKWAFKLPFKRLQDTQLVANEVRTYMEEIISEEKEIDYSVLKALVKGGALSKSELVSNAFIILLAGHESTYNFYGFSLMLGLWF